MIAVSPQTHAALLRDFAAGGALSTLARRHRLPPPVVHREIRLAVRRLLDIAPPDEPEADAPPRTGGSAPTVEAMLRRACAIEDIAATLGCPPAEVGAARRRLEEAGERLPPPEPTGADKTLRPCMACRGLYPSAGSHNRLCVVCREGTGLPDSWNLI